MTVNAVQEAAVMSNTSTTYKNEQDQRQILVKRQTIWHYHGDSHNSKNRRSPINYVTVPTRPRYIAASATKCLGRSNAALRSSKASEIILLLSRERENKSDVISKTTVSAVVGRWRLFDDAVLLWALHSLLQLHPFNGLFSKTTWASRYRKGKPVWIYKARDEGLWGCSGIRWTICEQSAPRSKQITTPTPHHSIWPCIQWETIVFCSNLAHEVIRWMTVLSQLVYEGRPKSFCSILSINKMVN